MDAAAFASLVSLSEVLQTIKRRKFCKLIHGVDEQQISDFQNKVIQLRKFLEDIPPGSRPRLEHLIGKIPAVVMAAKSNFDGLVLNQMVGKRDEEEDASFRNDLYFVVQQIELIKKELDTEAESLSIFQETFTARSGAISDAPSPLSQKSLQPIGFDERVKQLKEELACNQKSLKVIPIVGMGGIGKTTLARCVYDDPWSATWFDRRIWCTIPKESNLRNLLQEIVDDDTIDNISKLGEKLHKQLWKRRYLLVIDDLWSTERWDGLNTHFPDESEGSRIIVTTREVRLARTMCPLSSNNPFKMEFLDEDQSWELLRKKVFGDSLCTLMLEEIGRNIAKSCAGLPLSIVTIAGLLSSSVKTIQHWKYVSENVTTLASSKDDKHCMKVLSFSYENMPLHLKPCFLYLGRYDGDRTINIDGLTEEWICAGIIKPVAGKTLYETTKEYLKDLIDRNLVLISKVDFISKSPKTCWIHDLTRELCREKLEHRRIIINPGGFLWKGTMYSKCLHVTLDETYGRHNWKRGMEGCLGSIIHQVRRLKIHDVDSECPRCKGEWQLVTQPRDQPAMLLPSYCKGTRNHFHGNNEAIPLEDLDSRIQGPKIMCLPLSVFWNVIFLTERAVKASTSQCRIWDMPQLQTYLSDSEVVPMTLEKPVILEELLKLKVKGMEFSKKMIEVIPNVKFLHITNDEHDSWNNNGEHEGYCFENVECWLELKELCITRVQMDNTNIRYPKSLFLLRFEYGSLYSMHTKNITKMVPYLKKLILHHCHLGYEWSMEGLEFECLEYLQISNSNNRYPQKRKWRGDSSNFPKLEILSVEEYYLEKIPLDMGNIVTLDLVIARACCNGVLESAKQIIRNQRTLGNDSLKLHIYEGPLDIAHKLFHENEESDDEEDEEGDEEEEDEKEEETKGEDGEEEMYLFGDKMDKLLSSNKSPSLALKVLMLFESHLHTKSVTERFPKLKRLILKTCYLGVEWRLCQVTFLELQYLEIIDHTFEKVEVPKWDWIANASNFPKLISLEIINGWKLKKIPLDIGNIPTLIPMRVACCSYEVVESAKEIHKIKETTFQLLIGYVNSENGMVEDKIFQHEEEEEEEELAVIFDSNSSLLIL